MRDRVLAEGAVVEHFLRNPQVNYGHPRGAYDALPVATATSLRRVGDRWRMRWRWLEHDPFADRVRNAWDQGVLRAASIEFIPLASRPNAEGGLDYTKWELVGVALCPVPANPEAVRTCKALGLPVGDAAHGPAGGEASILALDDEDVGVTAGDLVEALRTILPAMAADEIGRVRGQLSGLDLGAIDDTFNPLANSTDRALLVDAIRTVVTPLLRTEFLRLTGKVD
jgi:hypothetical protein